MSIELKFLADFPEAIPQISQWYFDEWGHAIKDNNVEKISERIRGMLNRDKIPLHVLAVENNKILGVSQLKIREMDIYPDRENWLGGVYVDSGARHRGIATVLVSKCLELAKQFLVPTLYLQTEQMDGGLYARLGWKPIEKVHYNGVYVLVMERPV